MNQKSDCSTTRTDTTNPAQAPAPAAIRPASQAERRAPSPRIPPIGRSVRAIEGGGTPEERTKKTVAKLRGKAPTRDYATQDEKSFRELVAGPYEQKPDRPDGSHICSVNGCVHWAGFTTDPDQRQVAAVVLADEAVPYFICHRHFRGAIWGFRKRDELYAKIREARHTCDRAAIEAAQSEFAAFPRISAYGSLDKARADIERAAEASRLRGAPPAAPAPKPRQPKPAPRQYSANASERGTVTLKEARRAARTFLAEVLTPHMGGASHEREIRAVLRESAERENTRWDAFETKAREIIVGKGLETEVAARAFDALKLLVTHRKQALG